MIKPISSVAVPKDGVTGDSKQERLKKACAEFESLFINYMLKSMRSSVSETGFIGNSEESKIIESMFDEKLADRIAVSGRIGLGNMLFEKLKDLKL